MAFFFSRLCNRLKTRRRGLKLKGATNGLATWTCQDVEAKAVVVADLHCRCWRFAHVSGGGCSGGLRRGGEGI